MTEILKDFSEEKVIKGIKANFIECIKYWGKLPQSLIEHEGEIIRMTTGVPVASLNFITSTKPVKGDIDSKIENTIHFFESRKMPCLWWVFPESMSQDLIERLKANGFSLRGSVPCMAADLLNSNKEIAMPQGMTIQPVKKQAELEMWAETSSVGLGVSSSFKEMYMNFIKSFPINDNFKQRLYLGFFNGEPVATSLLFLIAGVAEVNLVSTIPSKREKGFGSLITRYSLVDASKMGYRVGVLESLPKGENVYKKLGFREYCRVEIYGKTQ